MTTLDIISDPVCPWCWIGKANLDRALEAAPDHDFQLRWRPFQLNPDIPAEGLDRAAYLAAKFGGPEGAREVYRRIEDAARAAGLEPELDRIARQPNTLDAHRLLRWAEIEGGQHRLAGELFRRYFREGADLGSHDVLTDAAEAVGLDGPVMRRLLAGEADRDAVAAEDAEARAMGVTGVPTFILGNRYVLTGAQPPELWARVIEELRQAAE